MADVQLCPHHAATVAACLRKTGHHDDSTAADRLRTDLAKQCPDCPKENR